MSRVTTATTAKATGQFYTDNGEIINPDGSVFTAEGINVYDSQMGDANQILADFPGINFIRLNCYSYEPPSYYASFIQTMTSAGVVVELEDHTNNAGNGNAGGGQGTAYTGQQLTDELNWYSSLASAYANNPYVWFGTDNEPPEAGLSTWEQETYSAIRDTGNTSPIMMELPGGGDPSATPAELGMTLSTYTSMSNIVVDAHFYGWGSNYSTDQQTVDAALESEVTGAQTIQSASGTVPVIIGEYGPSTNGQTTDPNGSQVETAVQQAATAGETSGAVAWGWDTGANDNLTNGSGQLTSYGDEVANWISTTSTPSPTPTPTPTPAPTPTPTPSPNDTVIQAGSSGSIVDASHNVWTISGGAVDENGAAAGYSANVAEVAYVNSNVWQENTANLWWEWSGGTWAGNGTSTSPLPSPTPTPTPAPTPTPTPTPSPTASANDTMVLAGSNMSIVDASGNTWTITAGDQVAVNGVADTTTANVDELAYVNGEVWQENTAGLWWGKTSPSAAWSPTLGTSTSPLPAPITASGSGQLIVTQSEVSIVATSGSRLAFIRGSDDILNLSGGTNTITDSGTGNVYIVPAAGNGSDVFTHDIINNGDVLDLKTALAATNWNGSQSTLSGYVTVTDSSKGAVIAISATSGGTGTTIASIAGATTLNLSTLLPHSIT